MRVRLGGVFCAVALTLSPSSIVLADDGKIDAPPPDILYNWTGFYAGAHLGALANRSEVSDPLGPSLFGNPNRATGGFGGVDLGYNHQSGIIVYGIEADIAFPDIEGTGTCSALSGSFINSNCKIGIEAFGTLTARLGVALGPDGRSLIYGEAGAAWYQGNLDLATNDANTGEDGNPYTTGHNHLLHWGLALGAGVEYALTGNWSMKAEYSYANFGDQAVTLLPSAVLNDDGVVVDTVSARRGHVSNELHAFKVGLNYHFGGSQVLDDRQPPSMKDMGGTFNGLGVEVGGRYWYSWGRHKYDLGLQKHAPVPDYSLISRITYDDTDASTGELVARVTAPWNLFAKGFIGGGSITGGRMNDEDFNIPGDTVSNIPYTNTLSEVTGDIPTYGTIDLGYDWWRAPAYRLGTYIGYNYFRETMGAYGITQLANPKGPLGPDVGGPLPPVGHAIITQEATWQSLRLGATGEFNLAPRVRLGWDAAYLPYVSIDAVDHHFFGNTSEVASINPLKGSGTGAQIEVMLSYDLTERLSVGVGARYWAMWTSDGYFMRSYDADNPDAANIPGQHIKLETERLGVLGQVLYRFD